MRAIEYLMELYPEKTGAEILAIQEQDKLDDQKAYEKRNAKKLTFIEDINTNGGYYRGRFGLDQHYFYRVFDLKMEATGEIVMQVESLVLFCNDTNETNHVTRPNEVNLERRLRTYERLDQFGLEDEKRVTKADWDAVNDYVNQMSKLFWGDIKKVS
jgi:hypothetical protein